MNTILHDTSKFKTIKRNPRNKLKTKLNQLIRQNNSISTSEKLPLIEGDFKLGYAYGNVKTHKAGNPLCLIISQAPSVTYHLVKHLNSLLSRYVPSKFSLCFYSDFLSIIQTSCLAGVIDSMDVKSLFTNVPVD